MRVPLTLITGPLGAGKTTLLRRVISGSEARLAVIVNEFGELGIDGRLIEGENVWLTELDGGCVCCSLVGEFEVAIEEILARAEPEAIVVETTGVAEPEALLYDVVEELEGLRLDGLVTVMDADVMLSFPDLGATTRMQIDSADLLLLNKVDLVADADRRMLTERLESINPNAPIVPTRHCEVDIGLLFGIARERKVKPPSHAHQPEYDAVVWRSDGALERARFEGLARELAPDVYRAKGFVRFTDQGGFFFSFVNGRWTLEPCRDVRLSELVLIGRGIEAWKSILFERLSACEEGTDAV
jgi:G3E family GTPase